MIKMTSITKKCPMCAETVPADAVFCPYCETRFEEEVQAAAPPPAAPAVVVSPPAATANIRPISPASPPKKKGRASLWIAGVLVLVIVLGALGTLLWTQRANIPAISALISTTTQTATITPPPTFTPTIAPTRTPHPTAMATPPPTWVTDFAQPILDAIASRTPNVQEDFNNNSGGFRADCGGPIEYLDGEMLLTGCPARRANIDYADFVVEFDAHIYPGESSNSEWSFYFRDQGNANPHQEMKISYNGDVSIQFHNDDTSYDFPRAANTGNQTNHIMIIGKGSQIAIYLNHQPLFYNPNSNFRYGDFQFWVSIILAVDNFRVWNIYDISVP
jgi:hypothetical protein